MKCPCGTMKLHARRANVQLFCERIRANRHPEQPSPLGWVAWNVVVVAVCHPERSRRGAMMCLEPQQEKPAESKFCFLKLPIVFGCAVSFAAISKKQNRKGSPQSLIYPLKGKLTSFVTKQFFAFGKVHQTLSRSRLRRFLPLSFASTAKTSTCAEMTTMRSHIYYDPRVLRMTS